MSTRYLIANWKMQLTPSESVDLARKISAGLRGEDLKGDDFRVVICPSHTAVGAVAAEIGGSGIALGGQDVFWEDKGAYTGEVSPVELKELGCTFCVVGHSERRQHLSESDEIVNRKVMALLRNDLHPIVCVGETKEERERGQRDSVLIKQVHAALANGDVRPSGDERIIIAYEPVWVIGTGQAVEAQDAAEAHYLIRHTLQMMYPVAVVDKHFAVIYGGSVDSGNFAKFLEMPTIEGSLVGGASLKAEEFVRLAKIAISH